MWGEGDETSPNVLNINDYIKFDIFYLRIAEPYQPLCVIISRPIQVSESSLFADLVIHPYSYTRLGLTRGTVSQAHSQVCRVDRLNP